MSNGCYRASCEAIRQDYHQWLCEKVDGENQYNLLLRDMDQVEFTPIIQRDINRAQDGLALREGYLADSVWSNGEEALSQPCSVLEMIIALAERMAFETSSAEDGNDQELAKRYFWDMVHNLGLSNCTDERYVELGAIYFVPKRLAEFVNRDISFDGGGGLFPLKRPGTDQSKQEIWYQMQAYLSEVCSV